jgi:hypothetical protein
MKNYLSKTNQGNKQDSDSEENEIKLKVEFISQNFGVLMQRQQQHVFGV